MTNYVDIPDGTFTWENERVKNIEAKTFGQKIQKYLAVVQSLRITRAFNRYSVAKGNLLAGGIAYSAIVAVAGALTIAFTALSVFLGNNKEIFDAVLERTNELLPGILKTEDNPSGLLSPDTLIVDNPFNIVTLISLIALLWSALALMNGLRMAIWAMFGVPRIPMPFVSGKLRDLGAFIVIGVSVVVTVAITAMTSFFADPILEFLNLPGVISRVIMTALTFLIGVGIDSLVFMFIFRVLTGLRIVRRDLVIGSLIAGTLSTIVRLLGTSAISSVSDNALLAPFAAIATLLLWLNLLARIVLNAGAFMANPPELLVMTPAYFPQLDHTPNFVTKSDIETLDWPHDPVSGAMIPDMRAGFIDKLNTQLGKQALAAEKAAEKAAAKDELTQRELAARE